MKIYVNGRYCTQPVTGVQRYAIELTRALDTMMELGEIDSSRLSFTLLAPGDARGDPNLKHIPLRRVGSGFGVFEVTSQALGDMGPKRHIGIEA